METGAVGSNGSANQINNSGDGTQNDSNVHTVAPGETLSEIAEQYETDVGTLMSKNPQIINPDMVYPGDRIQVPAATPESLQQDQITTDIDSRFGTSNSEFRVGNDNGGVTYNPGDGVIGIDVRNSLFNPTPTPAPTDNQSRGNITVDVFENASVALQYAPTSSATTFKIEASYASGINIEGEAGRLNGEYSQSAGLRGFYEVTLPTANASTNAALQVNPFDPSTIPQGASVTLHSAAFVNTEYSAAFRNIATQTNITHAAGAAIAIERTGENTVRVAAGPTSAIEAFNGVGLNLENLSVIAGRQDSLGTANVISAEFDISTPEGQQALNDFLLTGELSPGEGISDIVQIEKIDYQSQTRLNIEIGEIFQSSLAGPMNVGSSIQTTYADGSSALRTELTYDGNIPLELNQRFDAQGNEIVDARTYSLTLSTDVAPPGFWDRLVGANEAATEKMMADLLNVSLTGNVDGTGPVAPGQEVILTFTEAQMENLRIDALTTVDSLEYGGMHELEIMVRDYSGNEVSNLDFSVALARNLGNDAYGVIEHLFDIASGADGDIFNNNFDAIDTKVTVR